MRSKLNLTDEELMNTSWISLCLQMADFPYYKFNKNDTVTGRSAEAYLKNFIKKK